MTTGQIHHMDIITDASTVWCRVVVAIHAHMGMATHSNLGDSGNPETSTGKSLAALVAAYGFLVALQNNADIVERQFGIRVGEIAVPFVGSKKAPSVYAERGYRVYYGSTHWVKRVVVTREEKSIWYEIYDSEVKRYLYVPSHSMRLVPYEELTLLSPEVPNESKLIVIDLQTQMVTAFEGEKLVFSQRCSSGAEGTETPRGEFRTYHKGPAVHMTNQGDAIENIYNLPGVPWCSFFTGAGHALHGAYWHNDYGRPRSHGCVNLPSEAAKFIYRWSMPVVPADADYIHMPGEGTRVQVI